MAALTGFLIEGSGGIYTLEYYDQNRSAKPDPVQGHNAYAAQDATLYEYGALTDNLPIAEIPQAKTGARLISFLTDYYNRIHIEPNPVNLGAVSEGDTATIAVWNSFFESKTLTSITDTDTAGLTLTNSKTPPYDLLSLESRTYTLTVSMNGPATIDAEYLFDFPVADVTLSVLGFRAVVFPFRPNWKRPLTERLEWLTDVMTAYDGGEQRTGLRKYPRRYFEFETLVHGKEHQQFRAILWNWVSNVFLLPVWTDGVSIDDPVSVGDVLINVDTTQSDFVLNGKALLFSNEQTYELITLIAVTDTSVTAKETLTQNWPAGSLLYPIRPARLLDKTSVGRHTPEIAYTVLRWLVDEDSIETGADLAATHRGYPVQEIRPNWGRDITDDYQRKMSVFDVGTLRPVVRDESNITTLVQKMAWLKKNKTEMKTLRNYLYARKGKLTPVWIPTWNRDITVLLDFNAADTEIHIDNIGFTKHYGGIGKRDVRIELKDGSIFYRRLSTPIDNGDGTEKISIDSALGVNVAVADIKLICLMSLCRQDADGVELSWLTPTIGEVQQAFRSIQDDV